MKRQEWSTTPKMIAERRTLKSEARWFIAAVTCLTALLLCVAALFLPPSAGAQKPQLPPGDGACVLEAEVKMSTLKTTGFFVPGATIGIETRAPMITTRFPATTNPNFCRKTTSAVPTAKLRWQILERPPLSKSKLVVDTSGLKVNFVLDQPGNYRFGFSACAFGCEITLPDQTKVPVDPASREVVVRVLTILPPATSPALPAFASTATSKTAVQDHCAFDADHFSAAWLTVKPWSGPNDYELLEGEVTESQISRTDNDFNHYSQDWNIQVRPDPRHRKLLSRNSDKDEVEIEWERDYLPEMFRPTVGDRVSAIGYWVYDCGHGSKTEIHPPVLLAAQRPRTVELPEEFGTNAYVPGIITDIWVNREAGGGTDDCAATGLWQQTDPSKPPKDEHGRPIFRCLPDSEGFSHNPINRIFEFNIYLPRSPQALMAAVGKTAPEVPLYTVVSNPGGSSGPAPVVVFDDKANVPYLRVRIDLSNYTQQTYSRRIVAAWAHAAPDNWGARRWNVRVTSMNITDDTDPNLGIGSDGDWRFWVNTNNGTSEWAKLFDCGGCAHGNETFNGRPWVTNSIAPDRNLGADLVLFPNQSILLNTTGFDEDFYYEDKISPLTLRLPQMQVRNGSVTADQSSGKYILHYQVMPGEEVGRAQLTAAAKKRYDAYFLTSNDLRGLRADTVALLNASFSAAASRTEEPPSRPVDESERELTGPVSVKQVNQLIQRAQREKPAQLDAFFRDVDRFIQRAKNAHREDKASELLKDLKPAVPAALWRQHRLEEQLHAVSNPQ